MNAPQTAEIFQPAARKPKRKADPLAAAKLRAISVEVYLRIMDREFPGAAERLRSTTPALTLSNRASMYDKVVRAVLEVKGISL